MPPERIGRRALAGALVLGATGIARAVADLNSSAPLPAKIDRAVRLRRTSLFTSDGVRLSLLEAHHAEAAGPQFVFVPGWGMPGVIWAAQLEELGRDHRCTAIDPRGQGESEIAAAGYNVDRRAADLADVLTGRADVILVAWSLGVLEALHMVHRRPHVKPTALVLVDNSVGEPPAPSASNFVERLRRDRDATVDRFVKAMFSRPPPAPKIDELKRSVLRLGLEQSIELLRYPLPREHWRDIARRYDRPLTYAVTARLAEQARSLQRHRPATRIEVFEQASHALFVDEPERFNALLRDIAAIITRTTPGTGPGNPVPAPTDADLR